MNTSTVDIQVPKVVDVRLDENSLTIDLTDGRCVSVPLAWYPRLLHGAPDERKQWQLIGAGTGIHWTVLDEDISVENVLAGKPSGESQQSLKKWLDSRRK